MITVEVRENIYALSAALLEYQKVTGKLASEVLARNAPRLAFQLASRYRALKPAKGQIRAEAAVRLAAGEGTIVRPAILAAAKAVIPPGTTRRVRGVDLNAYEFAVRRELNVRSSGAGFLGFSWAVRGLSSIRATKSIPHYSRFKRFIGAARIQEAAQNSVLHLLSVLPGIQAIDPTLTHVAAALAAVRAEVVVYLERQAAKRLAAFLNSATRAVPRLVS